MYTIVNRSFIAFIYNWKNTHTNEQVLILLLLVALLADNMLYLLPHCYCLHDVS